MNQETECELREELSKALRDMEALQAEKDDYEERLEYWNTWGCNHYVGDAPGSEEELQQDLSRLLQVPSVDQGDIIGKFKHLIEESGQTEELNRWRALATTAGCGPGNDEELRRELTSMLRPSASALLRSISLARDMWRDEAKAWEGWGRTITGEGTPAVMRNQITYMVSQGHLGAELLRSARAYLRGLLRR